MKLQATTPAGQTDINQMLETLMQRMDALDGAAAGITASLRLGTIDGEQVYWLLTLISNQVRQDLMAAQRCLIRIEAHDDAAGHATSKVGHH